MMIMVIPRVHGISMKNPTVVVTAMDTIFAVLKMKDHHTKLRLAVVSEYLF